MMDRDFSKCDVCGQDQEIDRLHVLIDNGRSMRHVYCCRRHRYVTVFVKRHDGIALDFPPQIQMRSDLELEHLRHEFLNGRLAKGWE
jgi:hypothetical protein